MNDSKDPRRGWQYRLPPAEIVNHHDFYCRLVKGKRVLHVGCADHLELIETKMGSGHYLHTKLAASAALLHGVDINRSAIEFLRGAKGIADIFYCDVTADQTPTELLASYDIVLMPEVIEHLPNVGQVLTGARRFLAPEGRLVLGTPNSFKLHNTLTVLRGFEENNPDHKYYFSYVTLKSLLTELGFVVEDWRIYIYGNPNRRYFKYGRRGLRALCKSICININPWFGDGIIAIARPGPGPA